MIGTLFRLLWRLLVGFAAILLAYGTFFLMYPFLDHRMPLLFVLIILYIWVAYIGIPLLVRLWQLVVRPHHLPHYVTSGDGWSSDPINLAIVCKSEQQLVRAMERAGWYAADKGTVKNNLREAYSIFFNKPYPTAPFSKLYLFGRPQDLGFQIQTGSPPTPRHRHHIRFWRLMPDDGEKPHHHTKFWENVFEVFIHRKRQIWVGAATHDVRPFALRVRNFQVTHLIDEKTDLERDFVIATLADSGTVKHHETIKAGAPVKFRGQTFGVNIVTDGMLHVLELKK